jgi:uncharacterized cupredoxin-like copper-binding protein
MYRHLLSSLFVSGAMVAGATWAHEVTTNKKTIKPTAQSAEETPFGKSGDATKATRTIHITMSDRMSYTPDSIQVKAGETVMLIAKNEGKLMHELVLGRPQDLKAHAELMKKYPGMEHDEPYMTHVAPGKTETIVWQFTKPGEFQFGCLIPGHFDAGMTGNIAVK